MLVLITDTTRSDPDSQKTLKKKKKKYGDVEGEIRDGGGESGGWLRGDRLGDKKRSEVKISGV